MRKIVYLGVIFLFLASASASPDYKITYTINIKDDGAAVWNVEYRTVLASAEEIDSFENYTQQLQSVYLNEFKELMQNSVSEAAAATSREMTVKDFTANEAFQSTPTAKYGVIRYSFVWTNFAKADRNINIGDIFVGGLYLSKDDTLIIRYPYGYAVDQVAPQPDTIRDGLVWYGPRTFGAGEPMILLSINSFSWAPFVVVIFIALAGTLFIYMRKIRGINVKDMEADIRDLEESIVKLLKESGGALYQSEIGRKLNRPKSTVSSALNELNNKNIINKIKKGRENLIRLI